LVICAGMGYSPSEALWAMALLASAAPAARKIGVTFLITATVT